MFLAFFKKVFCYCFVSKKIIMKFSGCWGYKDEQDSQEISLTLRSLSVRGLDFNEIVPQT